MQGIHMESERSARQEDIISTLGELAEIHKRRWAADMVDAPERLALRVTELLVDLRLGEWVGDTEVFRLLPAAARFIPAQADVDDLSPVQERLI
jgi:hypothetical protein